MIRQIKPRFICAGTKFTSLFGAIYACDNCISIVTILDTYSGHRLARKGFYILADKDESTYWSMEHGWVSTMEEADELTLVQVASMLDSVDPMLAIIPAIPRGTTNA